MFGVIPNIKSKGVAARKVLQRMMHSRFDESEAIDRDLQADRGRSEIDTLIMWVIIFFVFFICVTLLTRFDREVDLVSPLVTPLTYEGLVDEIIGIHNGQIKVKASLLGSDEGNELAPTKGTGKPSFFVW